MKHKQETRWNTKKDRDIRCKRCGRILVSSRSKDAGHCYTCEYLIKSTVPDDTGSTRVNNE